jgi:hypothetical protein
MKRCTWCGKECADEADACAIDGHPLESIAAPVSANEGEVPDIQESSSPKRPKGIWIVTIWMAFTAGLTSLMALFIYFGVPEEERMISDSGVVVSVLIAVAMIASAVCAWGGFNWARFALIALAVVYYSGIARNLYSLWQSGVVPESRQMFVWTRMARAMVTMTAVVLYLLLNKNAKSFFRSYRNRARGAHGILSA